MEQIFQANFSSSRPNNLFEHNCRTPQPLWLRSFFIHEYQAIFAQTTSIVKQGTNIILAVLTLAVIGLYALHFSGTEQATNQSDDLLADSVQESKAQAANMKELSQTIAYINTDSIFQNYELAVSFRNDLRAEEERLTGQYQQDESKVMQEIQAFQQQASTMSQFEGRMKEKELIGKQQKLQETEQRFALKLQRMEADMNKELNERIKSFLANYSADKPYEVVLSYNELGIIRWGHDSLDITNEVIVGLNNEYAKEQPQSP